MKRMGLRIALLLAVALFGIGAGEVAVRIAAPLSLQPAILQPEAGAAYFGAAMLQSVEAGGVRYAGRPGAVVEVHGVRYQHNRLGLRGPEVRAPDERPAVRILLVGDSNAYGWGVAESDSLRARLEAALEATSPDRDTAPRFEVIAAAFPGYNSADQHALMTRVWPTVQPDIVLVAWYANDLERLGFHVDIDHALFCDPLPVPDRMKPTLWRSHLYRLVSLGRLGQIKRSGTLDPRNAAPRDYSARHLLAMRRFAEENGARFAVVDVPVLEPSGTTQRMRRDGYPYHPASAWLRSVMERKQIPTLFLLAAIENEPTALLWASMERNDHHPNAKAHGLFAAAVVTFLRDQGFLGD